MRETTLTKSQQILMWELFAAGGAKLNKDIVPQPKTEDRKALIGQRFVKTVPSGRSFVLELEDRGWRWIAESEPFPIAAGEKRVTAERRLLQSLMLGLKRAAEANGTTIQDLFRAASAPVEEKKRSPTPKTATDVENDIRDAFFAIAGRPARGNIRLSALRAKLGHIDRLAVDASLIAMWRAGAANLMALDNPRDRASEEAAALVSGAHTFHVVRVEE